MPYQPLQESYFDRRFGCEAVKLLPGQYAATSQHKVLVATLGGCVTACVFDPVNRVGGLNRLLLPSSMYTPLCATSRQEYGEQALETLVSRVLQLGAVQKQLCVKIFGGADILNLSSAPASGNLTVDFVTQYFRHQRVPIVSADTGGNIARKVYFFPQTGEVLIKKITRFNNDTILARESEHRYHLSRQLLLTHSHSGHFEQDHAAYDEQNAGHP
ncbi:chemoreceptor glutamine deamidase CheD [Salinimonas sp. HHU 13199]|uniref:Probable chemoreceptor glutamine deamidase CheD n=1 Tax=Salinimonas profundi TaxID=2729140 RepID=A0ABR8LR49_9ALTE|nr:chemoreceptor glutamine deamidase CheD [Salinimonas profundi]MBD3586404.1 chemoreceptor glutamine deamidase CheD [Salinimonas profundi]